MEVSRHDAGQRDDRDLGGAAADVDDHVAGRRLDRKPHADGRGHRLGHHEDLLGAGGLGAESRTARRSTSVMPEGTQTITLGLTRNTCLSMMVLRK